MNDMKRLLEKSEYNFIKNEDSLGNNVILLTLGGSHAYGTNNEKSDIDVRGCTLERASDIIGFSKFEQFIDTDTDTVIYGFNKLIGLLINCNPNTIEMLGCKDEHYLYLNSIGKELLNNRNLFLSKRCINSFGGYAFQQLNRLENALARDRLSQAKKEEHIANSIKRAMLSFGERYSSFDNNSIVLNIDKSDKTELESEIFLNINLSKYPLRDFAGVIGEMQSILKTYGKLNHRNKKKSEEGLDKHAMHLIRLYMMAIDILEKVEIITYRENELDLLRGIRKGMFRKEDGTYDDSFFDLLEEYQKRFSYAIKNTSLQDEPNMKEIEEFVMDVNSKIINDKI